MFPFLTAFALTSILTFLAVRFFPRFGLLDRPEKYGLKRKPIPYYGGLAIFFGFLISILIFVPFTREIVGLLAGTTFLTIVAFLDDRYALSPFLRLGVQILAGTILVVFGIGVTHITNPFGGTLDFSTLNFDFLATHHVLILSAFFTIAWVVLLTNTLNWLDGVAGLASGISGFSALVIFFLAARTGFHYFDQSAVISLAAILAGSAFAFTLWNFPPPKILLGDTGSMFFGFVLAALAIFSGGKIATAVLVLGFPLIDTAFVITRRIWKGHSPFHGDYSHLHHRLLAYGFSERQTVLTIYAASILFGGAALLINTAFGKFIALVIIAATMFLVSARLPEKLK